MRFRVLCLVAGLFWFASTTAWGNQIVLEGSDATAFHHDSTYTGQLFTFMQNGSPLPVLILGGVPLSGLAAGQATLAPSYSLSAFSLSNFSAVYIESVGGCCTQAMDPGSGNQIAAVDVAAIGAAEALGLNVTIENYGGGPQWGAILPAGVNALAASNFGGITGFGTAGGPSCTDGEVFNANGLSKGFTQPAALGCYEHQAYRTSAFTSLGFISLVDADPAFFGADGSALLALGGPLGTPAPSTVPEPGTLLLLGSSLTGLGVFNWKRWRSK
ncbi:MAG TPA: PEP-CTERM sorting domain-containing protein [Methylomirabilota bacterium]|nr:PEP-CTERM sorting domain-containing protein [Methylomirabilota bacterium]